MTSKGGDVVGGKADIVVDNGAVKGARGEDATIPGEGTNTARVAVHGAEAGRASNVPELNKAFLSADGNVVGGVGAEGNGGDLTVGKVDKLVDLVGGGIPEIGRVA